MTVAPVYNSKGSLGIGALSVAAPLGQVANAVPPRRRPVGFQIRLSRSCVTPVTRDRGVVTAVTRDIRDIIAVLPLALGILGPLAFKSGLMLAILSGTLSFDRR
jgi:hypothetical protein